MTTNIDKKITLYTFAMTIILVFSHWTHFYRMTNPTSAVPDYLDRLWGLLGSVSLVSFFMMAGYLLYRGASTTADVKDKLLRRLVYLGIPFLFWNLVALIYEIAYGLYKGNLDISFTDVLLGFSLDPFNSPTWYLLALLLLMCLSPLVIKLKEHPRVTGILLAALFVGVYLLYILWSPEHFALVWIKRLLGYLPAYFLGAYAAMCFGDAVLRDGEYAYNRFISIGAATLSVALVALVTLSGTDSVAVKYPVYLILSVLLWLAVPATVCGKAKITFPLTVAPFVYSMHSILILILNSLWTQKLFGGVDFPLPLDLLFHALLVGVLYLVCLGVALAAKKLLPERVYKIFAGGSSGRKML